MNAPEWACSRQRPAAVVTRPWAEVMPMERQLPAIHGGIAFFWGGSWDLWGTEAPRAQGLFCWKLVRINSLPCPPLCPAEVDKHNRSRSDTSLRGTKRKAAQSASLCREARVKLLLHVPQTKQHMTRCIHFVCLPYYTLWNRTSLVDVKTCIGNIASFSCCHSGRRLYFRKQLPNKAVSLHLLSRHTHTHLHAYTNCLDCTQSLAYVYKTLKYVFFLPFVWVCCWCYPIGNPESHPFWSRLAYKLLSVVWRGNIPVSK